VRIGDDAISDRRARHTTDSVRIRVPNGREWQLYQ